MSDSISVQYQLGRLIGRLLRAHCRHVKTPVRENEDKVAEAFGHIQDLVSELTQKITDKDDEIAALKSQLKEKNASYDSCKSLNIQLDRAKKAIDRERERKAKQATE